MNPLPAWLTGAPIRIEFRLGDSSWEELIVTFEEGGQRGSYRTPSNEEHGTLACLAHGPHPRGGVAAVFHWQEDHGPLAGRTGIDTFWFRHESGAVHMRGTFFVAEAPEYSEMRSRAAD